MSSKAHLPSDLTLAVQSFAFKAAVDPFKDIRAGFAAMDPMKSYREAFAVMDPMKSYREAFAVMDPMKSYREALSSLDTLRGFRELTGDLDRGTVADWSRELSSTAGEPLREVLTDLEATLEGDEPAIGEPLSGWLEKLPSLAQRRLFLLALAALWALADACDSFAHLDPPAHLDKVIIALLAIATQRDDW